MSCFLYTNPVVHVNHSPQDVIDEKDKILTANADRVNGLMRKLQGKEAELGQMSDKYKKNIANMEEEMEKMGGDVRKAEAELRRKQTELQVGMGTCRGTTQ